LTPSGVFGGRMLLPPWLGSLGNFGTSTVVRTLLPPCPTASIPFGNMGDGLVGFLGAFVPMPGCSVDGLLDFPLSFCVIAHASRAIGFSSKRNEIPWISAKPTCIVAFFLPSRKTGAPPAASSTELDAAPYVTAIGRRVVVVRAFVKKTQRTPRSEIELALRRGGAMMLRTGKRGRYRYHTCCTKPRHGETGCPGRTVPIDKLDTLVADYIEQHLKRFASSEPRVCSCARSSPRRAQNRQVLECPVLYRGGAPEEIRTPDPQIRSF
jgi:hypothetical protein